MSYIGLGFKGYIGLGFKNGAENGNYHDSLYRDYYTDPFLYS